MITDTLETYEMECTYPMMYAPDTTLETEPMRDSESAVYAKWEKAFSTRVEREREIRYDMGAWRTDLVNRIGVGEGEDQLIYIYR